MACWSMARLCALVKPNTALRGFRVPFLFNTFRLACITYGLAVNFMVYCQGACGAECQFSGKYIKVAVGEAWICAIKQADRSLVCAGYMWAPAPPAQLSSMCVFNRFFCGITLTGSLLCWGLASFGETTPPSGGTYTAVAYGRYFACALSTRNQIVCWGDSSFGQNVPSGPVVGGLAPVGKFYRGAQLLDCMPGTFSIATGSVSPLCNGPCPKGRFGVLLLSLGV